MTTFPELALAVRQPWAHAIIVLGKDVENRDWRKPNPALEFRGRVAIHASAGMTRDEYEQACRFMTTIGVRCPPAIELKRGGIIGTVDMVDIVKRSDSRWFFGPLALVLRNPEPCEFIPISGALGFFPWKDRTGSPVPPPARWMLPPASEQLSLPKAGTAQGTLL